MMAAMRLPRIILLLLLTNPLANGDFPGEKLL